MGRDVSTWVGNIYYRGNGLGYHARAAVLCTDRLDFDECLSNHLEAQGLALLWSEDVFEVLEWFNKFGHSSIMAKLARRIDAQTHVALSEGIATTIGGEQEEGFLKIEEIEKVEPLDSQFGVWPKLTVPANLRDVMFGQFEPTNSGLEQVGDQISPTGTYAILDSAKLPYLLTSYLAESGLEYQSLFQGDAQQELGEFAPYIVKLEENNEFTRKLFTTEKAMGLWEKELGIFFRSRASLSELRKHFRKFTRVQDETGKWYYFRFWESKGISDLSYYLVQNPQKFATNNNLFREPFINLVVCSGPSLTICLKYLEQASEPNDGNSSNIIKCIHEALLLSDFRDISTTAYDTVSEKKETVEKSIPNLVESCQNYYNAGIIDRGELTRLCVYELLFPKKSLAKAQINKLVNERKSLAFSTLESFYLGEGN